MSNSIENSALMKQAVTEGQGQDGSSTTVDSAFSVASTMKSDDTQESMVEPELLALIIELRLSAGGGKKGKERGGGTANGGLIKSATTASSSASSSSSIDTLDLCHRKIEKLPHEMVNIIRDDVVRLALGYNFINALPANFCELSRLRYLNIRANLMNTFPTVLCTLPSLEILDISRNKIRKLPSEPGRLLELRVLSISNNRLRKLPVWMQKMHQLRILKLEGNPVAWPPPHVSVMPSLDKATTTDQEVAQQVQAADDNNSKETAQAIRKRAEDRHMALWIMKLKQWIAENSDGGLAQSHHQAVEGMGSTTERGKGTGSGSAETDMSLSVPAISKGGSGDSKVVEEGSQTPGEPTRSIGATFLSIGPEALSEDERDKIDETIALPVKLPAEAREEEQRGELPMAKGRDESRDGVSTEDGVEEARMDKGVKPLGPVIPVHASPEQERDVRLKSQGLETKSGPVLQDAVQGGGPSSVTSSRQPSAIATTDHARSVSTANTEPGTSSAIIANAASTLRRGLVRNKKSLPDLRQNQSMVVPEQNDSAGASEGIGGSVPRPRRPSGTNARRPPLPQASSESVLARPTPGPGIGGEEDMAQPLNTQVDFSDGGGSSQDNRSALSTGLQHKSHIASTSAAAVEVERNSYFKRLSTLPASTISNSISVPVLQCVDATRGVLYALSQMHSALKQYIAFASDERMTSQLSRALDIASTSMAGLINSLDRFDSFSRIKGGTLNPMIVRGVLVSCSESVVTFRKIVSLLHLQLKTLQRSADIRYTRTLLLLLYGSLAEISHSWTLMEPLFSEVIPYLQGQDAGVTPTPNHAYTLPSIAEASSPRSSSSARPVNGVSGSAKPQRRRHAGSFSAHDVAQGAYITPTAPLPTHGLDELRKGLRPHALASLGEQQYEQGSDRPQALQIQQCDEGNAAETGRSAGTDAFGGPPTPRDRSRRTADESAASIPTSKRNLSNNNAARSDFQSSAGPADPAKILIDDHLVLLLVRVTSIAYSVWAGINDHLALLGVTASNIKSGGGITSSKSQQQQQQQYVTPESTPILDGDAFATALSPHTPLRNGQHTDTISSSSSRTVLQDQPGEILSPTSSVGRTGGGGGGGGAEASASQKVSSATFTKLKNLRDLTQRLIEQTNRLQACCDQVQERSGLHATTPLGGSLQQQQQQQLGAANGPTATAVTSSASSSLDIFQEVFVESSTFIKSILHISHFIRGLSTEHAFPKVIKVNLAQLTTAARDLTLHLHFLGGPSSASQIGHSASPSQSRGGGEE